MFSKNGGTRMSAELTAPHNQPPPQEPGIVEPTETGAGETSAWGLENLPALSTSLVELSPVASPASTPFPDIILTPRQRRALHYLARRRMLHARIIRRKVLANRTLTTDTPPATAIVLGTTEHISSIDSIKTLEPGPSTTIPTEDMQPTQGTSNPRGTQSGGQIYSDIPPPNNPPHQHPIIDTPPAVPIISRSQLTSARPTKQERTSILRSLPPMPPLPPRTPHTPVPAY